MRLLIQLYHFFGSIVFALALISVVAIFVIAGTLIESATQSHRFATHFTYSNPVFIALLFGFFINILFSATHRWPFQVKHIPFLVTHLGLLMILGGVLFKSYFGRQGTMDIIEGSATHDIFETDSYVISAESRVWSTPHQFDLKRSFSGSFEKKIAGGDESLQLRLIAYHPHSSERLATWIKGPYAYIHGLAPIPVHEIDDMASMTKLPLSARAEFLGPGSAPWDLCAIRTSDMEKLIEKLNILVDSSKRPCLAIVEDLYKDVYLYVFDAHGKVWGQSYKTDNLQSLIAYEEGYGGYAVQAALPVLSFNSGMTRSSTIEDRLAIELQQAFAKNVRLAPPLQMLNSACLAMKAEFPKVLAEFLVHWDNNDSWLYPYDVPLPASLAAIFTHLDWNHAKAEGQACHWTVRLIEQIEPALKEGKDLIQILQERKWPLLHTIEKQRSDHGIRSREETEKLLTLLTRQIFSATEEIPTRDAREFWHGITAEGHGQLYSAYLRAYGIHLRSTIALGDGIIYPFPSQSEINIETDAVSLHQSLPPENKLEDNVPKIVLYAKDEEQAQTISLTYDPYAKGLKWPVLNGKYLVRFQPNIIQIPYRIRLRNARQINYANSSQPFSYECDVIVTERATGRSIEKTISMNQVHETWDGYRFYLANISPSNEGAVKRVHIVVNHDPAKYWLTYPGAIILTIGIVLLFWLRPYKKNS